MVRTADLARLKELAAAATAPVINARTRGNHPCEVLGDLGYAVHQGRQLHGLKVGVVAPDANILHSWTEAAAVLPIHVVQVFAQPWHSRGAVEVERFSTTTDLAALAASDIIVTDCWPRGAAKAELLPFQVTADLLARYAPQSLFIPCPPVTRGQEVSSDAMSAPQCRAFEAKAFLLHAQNALLEAKTQPLRRGYPRARRPITRPGIQGAIAQNAKAPPKRGLVLVARAGFTAFGRGLRPAAPGFG